jgi:hypothetical protein
LLAKVVDDDAGNLALNGALGFFASKLAPAGKRSVQRGEQFAAVGGDQRVIVAQQFEHL